MKHLSNFAVAVVATVLAGCGSSSNATTSSSTTNATTQTSSGSTGATTTAAPERRQVTAAEWDAAVHAGTYESIALPEGLSRHETSCIGSSGEAEAVPEGSVRLVDAVPGGSSASLFREHGTDRVWAVHVSQTLHTPQPGMATPSTRCFETIVPLPAGTRAAGSITVR